ncbi:MAG: NAD(+)/NADH kinase [Thermoplasmata archaeon]
MKIGLVAHPGKPRAVELARLARARLTRSAEILLTPETADALGGSDPAQPLDRMEADVLLAFGGDGTFLMALQHSDLPLLPVNAGTVGFLAEVDGDRPEQLAGALDRLLAGQYRLEPRMRVSADVDGRHLADAVNEVVVHTSHVAKMRLFEIAVDGEPIGRVRADGVIVATPTGSTSYSLSAGGPIVDPSLEALIISSLAPFRSPARSVLLDPFRTIGIQLILPEKEGVVVVDGQTEERLPADGRVLCYRSPRAATFVRFGRPYFRRLQNTQILPWLDPGPPARSSSHSDGTGLPSAP